MTTTPSPSRSWGYFEDYVNRAKNAWGMGYEEDTIYGTAKCGQRYAILITSVITVTNRVVLG